MEENQRRERIPKVRFTKKSDQSTIKKLILHFMLENF